MRNRKRRTASAEGSDDLTELGRAYKARLEELLAFAQVYRGWSAKELAAFIGRDVHNVIPASGIPKLDIVAKLAEALDWQPGAVCDHLCGERRPAATSPAPDVTDYRQLNREAYRAFEEGRFEDMIALGLRMERVAASPDERAEACLRQWGGWDGLGRYEQAIDVLQRGLREPELSLPLRLCLRSNLALNYFVLGRCLEAERVAAAVLRRISTSYGSRSAADGALAPALTAMGLSLRSRCLSERDDRVDLAQAAIIELQQAAVAWRRLADSESSRHMYPAYAKICKGAGLTAEFFAGHRSAESALAEILSDLGSVVEIDDRLHRAEIEAWGWWCVFGTELVLDAEHDADRREQLLAQLTLKGHELAEASNNWALRERMLTVDYLRWTSLRGSHAEADEVALDREDLRVLAGAMVRFPGFRPFGWELVRRATRVD